MQKYRSERQRDTKSRRTRATTPVSKFCNYPQDDCNTYAYYGSITAENGTEGYWETRHPYAINHYDVWSITPPEGQSVKVWFDNFEAKHGKESENE